MKLIKLTETKSATDIFNSFRKNKCKVEIPTNSYLIVQSIVHIENLN